MKNVLALLGRKHRPDARALSAYLDRAVSADEAAAIEAHVAICAACARKLAGLQAIRALLSSLPQAEVPRSFHLRPADLALEPHSQPSIAMRLMPALSGAAAVAFAVLLAVSLTGVGEHHATAIAPESARILSAASTTGTVPAAPAASGAQAPAPAVPAAGGEVAAPTAAAAAAPAAAGAQVSGATPAANGLAVQPAAPASSEGHGAGPAAGTSAGTPASNPMTDAANGPEKAIAPPPAAGATPAAQRTSTARAATSSPAREWLLWAAIAAAVVAVASGAVSVRMWARNRR